MILAILLVAAASDLQPVLPRLVALFEQQTGHTVRVAFGSSGNFVAQIRNGAPFDVFLSADVDYPRQLDAAGFAEPGTLAPYATGSLVLWTRTASQTDLRRGVQGLTSGGVRRIAIANPDHAPYGRAAVAALRTAGVYGKVRDKLVLGENVAQAMQFAQSGNADAALISLTLARSPAAQASGLYVNVPRTLYPPIEQAAMISRAAQNKEAARMFLAFLKRPAVVAMLAEAGLEAVR